MANISCLIDNQIKTRENKPKRRVRFLSILLYLCPAHQTQNKRALPNYVERILIRHGRPSPTPKPFKEEGEEFPMKMLRESINHKFLQEERTPPRRIREKEEEKKIHNNFLSRFSIRYVERSRRTPLPPSLPHSWDPPGEKETHSAVSSRKTYRRKGYSRAQHSLPAG